MMFSKLCPFLTIDILGRYFIFRGYFMYLGRAVGVRVRVRVVVVRVVGVRVVGVRVRVSSRG